MYKKLALSFAFALAMMLGTTVSTQAATTDGFSVEIVKKEKKKKKKKAKKKKKCKDSKECCPSKAKGSSVSTTSNAGSAAKTGCCASKAKGSSTSMTGNAGSSAKKKGCCASKKQ